MNTAQVSELLDVDVLDIQAIVSELFGDVDELTNEQVQAVEAVVNKMNELRTPDPTVAIEAIAAEQQRAKAEAQHKAKLDQLARAHEASQRALANSALSAGVEEFVTYQVIKGRTFSSLMANGVDPNLLSPEMAQALEESQKEVQMAMDGYVKDRAAITLEIATGKRPLDLLAEVLPQQPVPLLLGSAQ